MNYSTIRLVKPNVNISKEVVDIYKKQKETIQILVNMYSHLNKSGKYNVEEEYYHTTLILVNLYKLKCALDDSIKLKSKLINLEEN